MKNPALTILTLVSLLAVIVIVPTASSRIPQSLRSIEIGMSRDEVKDLLGQLFTDEWRSEIYIVDKRYSSVPLVGRLKAYIQMNGLDDQRVVRVEASYKDDHITFWNENLVIQAEHPLGPPPKKKHKSNTLVMTKFSANKTRSKTTQATHYEPRSSINTSQRSLEDEWERKYPRRKKRGRVSGNKSSTYNQERIEEIDEMIRGIRKRGAMALSHAERTYNNERIRDLQAEREELKSRK